MGSVEDTIPHNNNNRIAPGSKMKLAIFVLTLVGAILASPQGAPPPGERAAFPQDMPDPVADRQDATYTKVTSGSNCNRITTKEACEEAAAQLGLADTEASEFETVADWPPYCFIYKGERLYYANGDGDASSECDSSKRVCICKKEGSSNMGVEARVDDLDAAVSALQTWADSMGKRVYRLECDAGIASAYICNDEFGAHGYV